MRKRFNLGILFALIGQIIVTFCNPNLFYVGANYLLAVFYILLSFTSLLGYGLLIAAYALLFNTDRKFKIAFFCLIGCAAVYTTNMLTPMLTGTVLLGGYLSILVPTVQLFSMYMAIEGLMNYHYRNRDMIRMNIGQRVLWIVSASVIAGVFFSLFASFGVSRELINNQAYIAFTIASAACDLVGNAAYAYYLLRANIRRKD